MDLFNDGYSSANSVNEAEAFEMLRELEQNKTDEIRRQRVHFRLQAKIGVTLQPGNASDLLKFKMKGATGDISEGGCCVLFPMPVRVGDVYRIEFDRKQLDLPLMFVRCLRCRMLREDAYEAGFRFFTSISLPETAMAAKNSLVS